MTTAHAPSLTYAFAKEHGVLVLGAAAQGASGVAPQSAHESAPERAPVRLALRAGAGARALIEARRAVGAPVTIEELDREAFERRLSEVYANDGLDDADLDAAFGGEDLTSLIEGIPPAADLLAGDDDAPIIRLINGLIAEAVKAQASDIHIEPYEERLIVRFRVDGVLREVLSHARRLAPLIVSRVKVMARLDIAEKRVPQDGRISLTLGARAIDVRVSTLPSRYGERVVMRLLDKDRARLDLNTLGMPADTLAQFRKALDQPNGVILVTGPTGSGKTTTLYAALNLLNAQSRNILTVEDPIEYGLEGVGQTQVNTKVGMTFASGLRAILRQDPDIVMVGEIRDVETAQIAVQASLTGHLVLSTVHTNSAVAAVTRLRDMGAEPFLLSSTLSAILAQRLVRRLCPSCKDSYTPDAREREMLGVADLPPDAVFYRPRGCEACGGLGYEGRIGLYELVVVDDALRAMIHSDAREQEMAAHAFRNTDTLLDSGARQVIAGVTSTEEVLRVARASGDDDGGV